MICIGAVIARSLVLVAALALAAGCNGRADEGADTTLPPPPAPTTSVPADPYAVPAAIDEAYVNRVLAALDQVDGEAVRTLVSVVQIDPRVGEILRSVYNDPQYGQDLEGLTKTDLSRLKVPPGNLTRTVSRLVEIRGNCIRAEVSIDYSQVAKSPPPRPTDEVNSLTLRPTQPEADPTNLNPTPWSISDAQVLKPGQTPRPEDQCAVLSPASEMGPP